MSFREAVLVQHEATRYLEDTVVREVDQDRPGDGLLRPDHLVYFRIERSHRGLRTIQVRRSCFDDGAACKGVRTTPLRGHEIKALDPLDRDEVAEIGRYH